MNHHSPLTILVIDDCAEDRQIYRYFLQPDKLYTYNLVEFETVTEAMVWCEKNTADVILLDYLLPDADGLEFLEKLSQCRSIDKSAVIMLTGQGDESIAVRAMKSGVQDYLSKNYLTPEVLQGAIHHALERVHLTRQLEQSRQQQQLMHAIALRIHQSLKLAEILDVTAAEVRQFLQVDRVVIYQFHPNMAGSVVAESILPGWTVAMGVELEDNCFEQYKQWRKRAIPDVEQAGLTECYLELLARFQVKATLSVPIFVSNQIWGLLIAHQCTAPRQWQSFELNLLDQLAVQIAIAIQQASAYEQLQAQLQERKRVEASLRESEQRFRQMADTAPVLIWMSGVDKVCQYFNKTWLDFTGKTLAQEQDNGWAKGVHPDDLPGCLEIYFSAFDARQKFQMEYRLKRFDGEYRWILDTGTPRFTSEGQFLGYIGSCIDISDRKYIEQALIQNEERLSMALDAAGMGNWEWNISTGKIHWSPSLEKLFGINPGSFNGQYETVVGMMHPDDRHRVLQAINRAVYERQDYNIEFRFIKPDGKIRWALGKGRVFYDQQGNPLQMSGVDVDITERKQAEAALQLSEARFQAFMNHSPALAWITNQQAQIVYMSQTYFQIIQLPGETVEDVIGKSTFEVYPPEIAQPIVNNIRQVVKTQQILKTFEQAPKRDGTLGEFLVYKFPLPETNGQFLVGGVAVDITDKVRAEQALQQLNQELEARVTERTATLRARETQLLTLMNLQQAILECTDYAIISLDSQGIIQTFNTAAQKMLGYTPDQVVGKLTPLIFHDSEELKQQANRLSQKLGQEIPPDIEFFPIVAQIESNYEQEWTYIRQDGTRFPVLLSVKILSNLQGQTIGCLGIAKDITQQKQIDRQFRKNAANLAAAQRIAHLGSWEFDLDTQEIIWSEEVFRIFGRDLASGTPSYEELLQFTHPEDRQTFDSAVQEAIAKGESYQLEYRYYRLDGSLLYLLARGEVVLDQHGKPLRLFGIIQDITERKQVEAALRQSEHRYATLAEASPVAIMRFDTAGNCIYVNERWSEMTGRPTQAALGKGWVEALHPEDRDHLVFLFCCLQFSQWLESLHLPENSHLLVEWPRSFKQREFFRREGRLVHSDGSIIWVYCQALPETNPNGTIIGHVGTLTDISDRKQFELEVIQNRDLREAIFNESADAIFLVDANTHLIFDCNRRAVELFEATNKQELINIDGHTLQRHQFNPQELAEITQQINQQSCWSQEIEYVTCKGNLFWGNLAAKQITVAGKVINLVRVSDISDRKKTIEQIQRSLEEKDTLLKEIHHRVKNNLQIISSLLRMQTRRSVDQATLMLFQESQNRVQSMALIHEHLYQSPDISQIDFGDYIRSLTDNLFRSYGISQRKITLNIETNNIKLTLDHAIPCGLMINELVSNSLKYAFPEQQRGNIIISLEQVPENQLILIVKDNGIGIPETLDWENTNSLGLRIVKNLTRQLKGNMLLQRDRGTSFYIYFAQ